MKLEEQKFEAKKIHYEKPKIPEEKKQVFENLKFFQTFYPNSLDQQVNFLDKTFSSECELRKSWFRLDNDDQAIKYSIKYIV